MTADAWTETCARYGKAFEACEQLVVLEQKIRATNPIHADGGGRLAVVVLQAKARKTFNAILVLARDGYGEDALILARSLTNLCIDPAFMTTADTPKRVRAWLAYARVQLRKWASAVGRPDFPVDRYQSRKAAYDRYATTLEDTDSFLPLTPLRHLAAEGVIGGVASHLQMITSEYSQRNTLTVDAPEILRQMREDGVDVALLAAL